MTLTKKPPDKYKCLKLPVSSILRTTEPNTHTILQTAIQRTNAITTKTYFLLRRWVLEKYHSNKPIPEITTNTISMCAKSIMKPSAGPKAKGNNLVLLQEFQALNTFELEDGKNLSSSLDYYYVTMLTSIENNIRVHYFDYVKRFVNSFFKNLHQEKLNDRLFKKQLFKELSVVKNDILNNTLICDVNYHSWLQEHRYKIIPKEFDTNYYYDLKAYPYKYLPCMIYMCLELEKIGRKSFQFFPLQTNAIPRHIQIDTKALIELFVSKEKKQYLDNIELHKEILWSKHFDIQAKLKNYLFDHTIITDGYAVSLRFIHKDCLEEERIKKAKMKKGKQALKCITEEQKTLQQEKKAEELIKKKEEGKKKRLEAKEKPKLVKKIVEFPYVDEVEKTELQGKHIFIDPGKRTLLSMMDDDGAFFSYTNSQRVSDTKRFKYHNVLKKYRDAKGITKLEENLLGYNSKSCILGTFQEYVNAKIKANVQLISLYQDIKFRKYKWYSFINTKRTEDRMLNSIEKKYSKDHIIIMGDWSVGKQMRNFLSTPNLSIKRKLAQRFQVFNIDEFRTSCLYYKTEECCENLYLPDKTKKERKMHSILTFQMENKRMGCINRDKNGCKNIQKVFTSYIEKNERPEKYRREYKFVEPIRVSNRCKANAIQPSNRNMPLEGHLHQSIEK